MAVSSLSATFVPSLFLSKFYMKKLKNSTPLEADRAL